MSDFRATVSDLFASKKFLTSLVGVIVTLAAKFGLNLEPELVVGILSLFVAAIVGQGIADVGKEKAIIQEVGASERAQIKSDSGAIHG